MSEVLEEHFTYLSLNGRSELYDEALASVLRPGAVVADLGCGFGVLGMQCLRLGAARVYGVDSSEAIHIARESVARAGLAERYHCLAGSTYRTELPEQVDLVLCDHVGWFGMDYGIIPMLQDARHRFLKPGGAIMPRRLRLCIAATSARPCREKIEQWSQPPIPPEFHWVEEYQLNTKQPHLYRKDEICSAPAMLGAIDLEQDNGEHFAFSATLEADRPALVTGLAGWFEAELAEGVWMTNSPLAERRIARNQAFFAAREPFAVRPGDQIALSLRLRHEGEPIAWSITPPGQAKRQKLSTWSSQILSAADLTQPQAGPVALNAQGQARAIVLGLVDGKRTGTEIEEAVLAAHPQLFPTETAIRRFVRAELARWGA